MYPAWIPPFTGGSVREREVRREGGGGRGVRQGEGESVGPEYRLSGGFEQVSLTTKRRRWGRFIGLRGCESPITITGSGEWEAMQRAREKEEEEEEEEGLVERMEREWRNTMRRARDEEMIREKGWRGRW